MDFIKLSPDALSVEEVSKLVTDPSCGAISLFMGTTRDNFKGKNVIRLEYEAYNEMAKKEMSKLCQQAREKWTLKHIAIHHRLGLVPVTESSVIIAVSSEHRRESLDAVSFIIDELKAHVPIWKKEMYDDGTGNWKANKECKWENNEGDINVDCETKEVNANINKRTLPDDGEEAVTPVSKKIKKEETEDPVKEEDPCNVDDTEELSVDQCNQVVQGERKQEAVCSYPSSFDPSLVQIVATKKELDRRITAFQQHKRDELDVLNVQEFCSVSGGASVSSSCARTSAVVLRTKGSNSHLKLTRVINDWGPQTLGMDPGSMSAAAVKDLQSKGGNSSSGSSREGSIEHERQFPKEHDNLPSGIEERLHNMEMHLKLGPGHPVPKDVYSRLKALENRLLYLEGISPEYFHDKKLKFSVKSSRHKEIKAAEDDMSLDELDRAIYQLKMKLKEKQLKQVF